MGLGTLSGLLKVNAPPMSEPSLRASVSYRPDIDGLRAVAVLAVLVFHLHASALPGGFLGVDVFFAISGYVVTGSLLAQPGLGFGRLIGEFYAKRFARILPALCGVLLATSLVASLLVPQSWLSELSDKTGLYAYLGLSNWVMQSNADTYFAPRAEFNPYTHTWSLGVEEQFYLLAPLLIYAFMRWGQQGARARLLALGTAGLLCAASGVYFVQQSSRQPDVAFYFIACRFWELGVGMVLRLVHQAWPPRPARSSVAAGLSAGLPWLGLAGLAAALVGARPGPESWVWNGLAVLGAMLVIQAGATAQGRLSDRLLGSAVPVWLGKRSYSIYLWHWPVCVLLRWTVGLDSALTLAAGALLTLLLALASYRWLEVPLRHSARLEARPAWARILIFALFPLLGYQLSHTLFRHRNDLSLSTVARHAVDWYAGSQMPYVNPTQRNCQVAMHSEGLAGGVEHSYQASACQTPARRQTVNVIGDSHAGAYLPMLEQLSADTGVSVHLYTFPSCPYLDLSQPQGRYRDPGCLAFSQQVVKKIADESRPGDLLFMPSLRMPRYGDQWASFNIPDMRERIYNAAAEKDRGEALAEAPGWLLPLAQQGLYLIFEAPKPIFQAPTFRCADVFNRHNPICVGDNQQPRSTLLDLRAPVMAGMQRLSQQVPGLSIWDPLPVLCPGEVCSSLRDGRPLFFDGDHPSAYGNWVLYPDFKQKILSYPASAPAP